MKKRNVKGKKTRGRCFSCLLGLSGLLLVDDGVRAAADLAETANDLEDNEDGGNNKEVDGGNKIVRTELGLGLERDDEQNRNEDERDSLAGPREVERHERAQLGGHEDLDNNDVQREDAVKDKKERKTHSDEKHKQESGEKEKSKHEVDAEDNRDKGRCSSHPKDRADERQDAADDAKNAEDEVESVHCEWFGNQSISQPVTTIC